MSVVPPTNSSPGKVRINKKVIPITKLTLVIFVTVVLILLVAGLTFGILRRWYRKLRKTYTNVNAKALDRLNVVRLIKANASEDYEINYFNDLHREYNRVGRSVDQRESLTFGIFMTAISSINIIAVVAGIIFITFGLIKPSEIATKFVPFVLSTNTLIFPIFQTIGVLGRLASTTISIQRLESLLEQKSEIVVPDRPHKVRRIEKDIVFENVCFAYKAEKYILENFSFRFKRNKSYALVGTTGAGKTTISKLLLRFYDPQRGRILINGHDLRKVDLKSYLSRVGYIEQEPEIFNGTIAQNITYGSFDASPSEIETAAEKANLANFIASLPAQYETIVGEKGFILSGGQKQRILIARMLLKNPDLIILDEATSALDNIVERQIQAQLNQLAAGRTSIIIAHRLSTIQNVDQILVLAHDKGLVQVGTFSELVKKPGYFQKLYQAGLMKT
ncbi:ABC transporter B family member 10-like [Centruroides sculpturatus]|uniref:ABC transporter B family member 10-like n=1 Tax=Centruroides sculpturatus TaxID=218467 RepID=UPI000C6D6AAE|nr:ABC transporter B family member 10-like [Centruroides sculpturatus]